MSTKDALSDPQRLRCESQAKWRWALERFVITIALLAAVYSTVVLVLGYILSLAPIMTL
jgi:hypothetical protein